MKTLLRLVLTMVAATVCALSAHAFTWDEREIKTHTGKDDLKHHIEPARKVAEKFLLLVEKGDFEEAMKMCYRRENKSSYLRPDQVRGNIKRVAERGGFVSGYLQQAGAIKSSPQPGLPEETYVSMQIVFRCKDGTDLQQFLLIKMTGDQRKTIVNY